MGCRPCGKDRRLVSSHIIPKSVVRQWTGCEGYHLVFGQQPYSKRLRYGHTDSGILCGACEQSIGRYDEVGAEFCRLLGKFEKKLASSIVNGRERALTEIEFDATALLSFILSVVWRASVCSLDFFKGVSLGPLEKEIQHFLLDIDANWPSERYDAVIGSYGQGANKLEAAVLDPQEMRYSSVKFLKFHMGPFWAWLKIDRQKTPDIFKEISLRSDPTKVRLLREPLLGSDVHKVAAKIFGSV